MFSSQSLLVDIAASLAGQIVWAAVTFTKGLAIEK